MTTLKQTLICLTTILFAFILNISYSADQTQPKATDPQQDTDEYLMTMVATSGEIEHTHGQNVLIIKHADERHITFFQNNPLQLIDSVSNKRLVAFWRFNAHDLEITPPQAIIMIGKLTQTAQIKEISTNRTENRYVLLRNNRSIQPTDEDEPAVITILLSERKLSWWCLTLMHCKR